MVKDEGTPRMEKIKAENHNPYEVPAEVYDQEHFSRVSVVLADSLKPDF